MSDYQDGKNVLLQMPQPGRPVASKKEIVEKVAEKENKIDTDAIANAVIKAIGNKMPIVMQGGNEGSAKDLDAFDNSKTLERLADSMVVHSADSESNFEGLGTVKTTKRDQKDTQGTIDLLSNID